MLPLLGALRFHIHLHGGGVSFCIRAKHRVGGRAMELPRRLTDAQLLDFTRSHLPHGDDVDPDALLAAYGDLYRNHLAIAVSILRWRDRLAALHSLDVLPGWSEGEGYALAEIAAHLRQGDFLPYGEFMG